MLDKIAEKVRNLFADVEVTDIKFADMAKLPIDEWQYINDGQIRYRIKVIEGDVIVSVCEWIEDAIFNLHTHSDCDETCFVIRGKLHSQLDGLTRGIFQKLYYKKNTIHKVAAKAGTLITVKFERK